MDIRPQVHALVKRVEAGEFAEAIDTFYADDAQSVEPFMKPTVGKPALLAKERAFLTTVKSWDSIRAVDVLVDGAMVAIHWKFEITLGTERRIPLEEIALQMGKRRPHERSCDRRFFASRAAIAFRAGASPDPPRRGARSPRR